MRRLGAVLIWLAVEGGAIGIQAFNRSLRRDAPSTTEGIAEKNIDTFINVLKDREGVNEVEGRAEQTGPVDGPDDVKSQPTAGFSEGESTDLAAFTNWSGDAEEESTTESTFAHASAVGARNGASSDTSVDISSQPGNPANPNTPVEFGEKTPLAILDVESGEGDAFIL